VIRAEMERRGETAAGAERVMGMGMGALAKYLRGETMGFGQRNCERVARYLGRTVQGVQALNRAGWDREKYGRHSRPRVLDMTEEGSVLTYWGEIREPSLPVPRSGCGKCGQVRECRAAAAAGRPLPCERFLEREVWGNA